MGCAWSQCTCPTQSQSKSQSACSQWLWTFPWDRFYSTECRMKVVSSEFHAVMSCWRRLVKNLAGFLCEPPFEVLLNVCCFKLRSEFGGDLVILSSLVWGEPPSAPMTEAPNPFPSLSKVAYYYQMLENEHSKNRANSRRNSKRIKHSGKHSRLLVYEGS